MAEDDLIRQLLVMEHARAEMHRAFIRALLRRLAIDVPGFSLDLLSEQLHMLVQNLPPPHSAPDPVQALSARTGHEELRKLIEAVDGAIADATGGED